MSIHWNGWQPRKEQEQILEKFQKFVEHKKKFYVIESPVGTGKSMSIMMMAKWFQDNVNKDAKFDILTNQKALQEQYLRDFKFVNSVKGKENYYCSKYRCTCSEGMSLSKLFKKTCEGCEYAIAKHQYVNGEVGLLNFHLYVSYLTYAEDLLTNRKANILFIDEAHAFEEVYCDFINSYISIPYLQSLGITITEELKQQFDSIKTKQQFADFVIKYVQLELIDIIKKIDIEITHTHLSMQTKIDKLKNQRRISRSKCKYGRFLNDKDNWDNNWILETGVNNEGKYHKVDAVWGKKYLTEIWDKYDHVVLLTGTVLDKLLFSNLLSIDVNKTTFLSVESPFKIENRKIFYLDKGKFSYDKMEETFEKVIPEIKKILSTHKDQKGIIHTGNYKLASWIEEKINDDRLLFHDSSDREKVLQYHYNSKQPTVLVSPSMINGVDLKGDLSRFQVILKIPFPALENEKIKIRMEQNHKWYQWKTLCDVCQMYGRSVRSEDDYATTYIIDSNFDILIRNVSLSPYIREAIQ